MEVGRARVLLREARALLGHEGREAVAIDGPAGRHLWRMAPLRYGVMRIPGDATTLWRLVRSADVTADQALGDAGRRIDVEEAGTAVGAAVQAGGRRCGRGAATKASHRAGSSGDGRCGGTGHHVVRCSCAFWRAGNGVIGHRLRGRCSLYGRIGTGALLGWSGRRTGSDHWRFARPGRPYGPGNHRTIPHECSVVNDPGDRRGAPEFRRTSGGGAPNVEVATHEDPVHATMIQDSSHSLG